MAEQQTFRTAFNGFHRDDVVQYIEELNAKHAAEVNQLNNELQYLQEKLAEYESGTVVVENADALPLDSNEGIGDASSSSGRRLNCGENRRRYGCCQSHRQHYSIFPRRRADCGSGPCGRRRGICLYELHIAVPCCVCIRRKVYHNSRPNEALKTQIFREVYANVYFRAVFLANVYFTYTCGRPRRLHTARSAHEPQNQKLFRGCAER